MKKLTLPNFYKKYKLLLLSGKIAILLCTAKNKKSV